MVTFALACRNDMDCNYTTWYREACATTEQQNRTAQNRATTGSQILYRMQCPACDQQHGSMASYIEVLVGHQHDLFGNIPNHYQVRNNDSQRSKDVLPGETFQHWDEDSTLRADMRRTGLRDRSRRARPYSTAKQRVVPNAGRRAARRSPRVCLNAIVRT